MSILNLFNKGYILESFVLQTSYFLLLFKFFWCRIKTEIDKNLF